MLDNTVKKLLQMGRCNIRNAENMDSAEVRFRVRIRVRVMVNPKPNPNLFVLFILHIIFRISHCRIPHISVTRM